MASTFLNLSTDTTLGGNNASDEIVASQKAVKSYVDGKIPTVDSALSTTSTNPVQNKLITAALNGKLDGYNLKVAGQRTGGVHPVNFITFNYSECNSENGIFIKLSMVNSHGNGITGRFYQDVILNCSYTGVVAGTLYRYFGADIDISSSEYYGSHKYGDIFWTIDTTNKIVKFYVLMRQYSYTYMTPYFRLNASTKGVITQHTGVGAGEYSSGTQSWATINNFEDIAKKQDAITSSNKLSASLVSGLSTVATSGSYNDLSNKPTIPTTTSSVTSGSTAALTSGGAYTALQSYQTTANLVTSVSSSSTDSQYPSAKLFYDTCGDIESAINTIRGV